MQPSNDFLEKLKLQRIVSVESAVIVADARPFDESEPWSQPQSSDITSSALPTDLEAVCRDSPCTRIPSSWPAGASYHAIECSAVDENSAPEASFSRHAFQTIEASFWQTGFPE